MCLVNSRISPSVSNCHVSLCWEKGPGSQGSCTPLLGSAVGSCMKPTAGFPRLMHASQRWAVSQEISQSTSRSWGELLWNQKEQEFKHLHWETALWMCWSPWWVDFLGIAEIWILSWLFPWAQRQQQNSRGALLDTEQHKFKLWAGCVQKISFTVISMCGHPSCRASTSLAAEANALCPYTPPSWPVWIRGTHPCVFVYLCLFDICVSTLVGESQPPEDESCADSITQLLNFPFANSSHSKARNTMIKQLSEYS